MGTRDPFWQPSQDLHSRDLGLRGDTRSGQGTSSSSGFWLGSTREMAMEGVRSSCRASPPGPGLYPGTTIDIGFRNYKPHSWIENHQ